MVLRACVVPDAAPVLETGCDITGTRACKIIRQYQGREVWKKETTPERGTQWHKEAQGTGVP